MTETVYHASAIGGHETQPQLVVAPLERATGWVNPYAPPLPAIGRLIDLIWQHGPAGTLIETSNRDLAVAIRCSAGLIPDLLRRLADDGYITSVPHTRGTLIEVLR